MPGHFLNLRQSQKGGAKGEEDRGCAGKPAIGTLLPSAFLKFVCLNQSFFPNQSPEADTSGGDWLVALAD